MTIKYKMGEFSLSQMGGEIKTIEGIIFSRQTLYQSDMRNDLFLKKKRICHQIYFNII